VERARAAALTAAMVAWPGLTMAAAEHEVERQHRANTETNDGQ